jgi:hypothetical protein
VATEVFFENPSMSFGPEEEHHMTINWQLALPCAVAVSSIIVNGCTTLFADQGQVHVGDSLNIYAPFDNSRDRGPSYLVGAPGHYLGTAPRIDDSRTDPGVRNGVETPAATSAPSALPLPAGASPSPIQADDSEE